MSSPSPTLGSPSHPGRHRNPCDQSCETCRLASWPWCSPTTALERILILLVIRWQRGQKAALTAHCANSHSPPNGTRSRALLTANSCWHLVCARLGALHKASQCRQWLKASAAEERFLQTNSFLLWDYFFFLSKHQNYLICKYMYESPEESLNLSLNYWKFIIIFSWKKSRISSNPTCSHLLKLNASWPREKLRKPLK